MKQTRKPSFEANADIIILILLPELIRAHISGFLLLRKQNK